MTNAGHLPDVVQIGAVYFSSENRAFLEHGVQHARQSQIDAVNLFGGYDVSHVTTALRMPNDFEILGVLQFHVLQVGRGKSRRLSGKIAVTGRTPRCVMENPA